MLKYHQFHQQLKDKTGLSIEKRAVSDFMNWWENMIDTAFTMLPVILEQTNKNRKKQGLPPLKRIDQQMIREIITFFNDIDHIPQSQNNDGGEQKETKNIDVNHILFPTEDYIQ